MFKQQFFFHQHDLKISLFLCRTGAVCARKVKPVTTAKQGVVCSMKDNYGFIERADVVKEIFFHYSGYQGDITELVLGDDVEFNIQMRNVGWVNILFRILYAIAVEDLVSLIMQKNYFKLSKNNSKL